MLKKMKGQLFMNYEHRVLPFYMTCGMPAYLEKEDRVIRDLEYLEQIYPEQAKKLQVRIADILDKIDYEGSMIYDEYPDKWQLYRLKDSVIAILKQEESDEKGTDSEEETERWKWIGDMVQLMLYYEIYKRRHGGRRGFLKF
jgi:hypothetical protein